MNVWRLDGFLFILIFQTIFYHRKFLGFCIFVFLSSSYVTVDELYTLRGFADKRVVISRIYIVC